MGRERLMTAKKKILKTIAAAAVIIAALAAVSVLMVNFSVKNSVEDKIIYTVTGERRSFYRWYSAAAYRTEDR